MAGRGSPLVICPNCSAGEISPLTHRCELCGFVPEGVVAVEAPRAEALDEVARVELAERFRFDEFLGRGDASVVYLAREQGSSRQIVVKVMPRPADRRPDLDDRFRRAVESVAALEHPHIVPVFDHGRTDHLYWYSMEHVRGRSLRDFLLQRGRLDLKACLRVVAQVASALDHAHRRGIVHGALKPANVLIDTDGWVHVADLMVRRALEGPSLPAPAPPDGARALDLGRAPDGAAPPAPPAKRSRPRPPHTAPEDLCTAASDQYALAVLVSECLEGLPLDDADAPAQAPGAPAQAPAHVRNAIQRALSPKPIDRFASVLDFVAALETYVPVAGAQPSGRSSGVVLRQTDWRPPGRRIPWRLVLGGAVLVAAIGAGVWQLPALQQLAGRLLGRATQVPLVTDSLASVATPGGAAAAARPGSTTVSARGSTAVVLPRTPPATVARNRPSGERGRREERRESALRAEAPRAQAPAPAPATGPAAPSAAPTPAAATAQPAPAPTPAEPGRLFVNSTPWGQIFLDGQPVGNTPKADLTVSAGPHTLRVVREGFEPFERSLQVAPGQVIRLTGIVLAPVGP